MYIIFFIVPVLLSVVLGSVIGKTFANNTAAMSAKEHIVFWVFWALQILGYGFLVLFIYALEDTTIQAPLKLAIAACFFAPLFAYFMLCLGKAKFRQIMWFLVSLMPVVGFFIGIFLQ